MKFPIFASFIIFCIWLSYEIRKHGKNEEESSEAFWETERRANSTRRKSLDDLNYITIPFASLPMDALKDNPAVKEYHETLHTISEGPIVNFTGISNTDLKLKYGAPNIDLLMLYDQRYTTLARTLQSWAKALYDNSLIQEAQTVLEFAIETRTDVSASYKLLATIYQQKGENDKIAKLIPVAGSLNSALSSHIAASLEEMTK
ncbi:MAG: hypothetical protein ACI4SD_02715 [Suilimivivens sp.]